MSDAVAVIPWQEGCEYRKRALDAVRAAYRGQNPDISTVLASIPEGVPWVKADAVMPAVEAAPDGVVVLADADVLCAGIESAVRAVTCGVAGWAIPHEKVYRLSADGTTSYLAGADHKDLPRDRSVYRGLAGGGILVAHRDTLLEVPMDPRFIGWGQEDQAHALALTCLVGKPWRGTADLVHLFHPPQERMDSHYGSTESRRLLRRYTKARRDPKEMRDLIEEVSREEHREAAHAPLHDLAPR